MALHQQAWRDDELHCDCVCETTVAQAAMQASLLESHCEGAAEDTCTEDREMLPLGRVTWGRVTAGSVSEAENEGADSDGSEREGPLISPLKLALKLGSTMTLLTGGRDRLGAETETEIPGMPVTVTVSSMKVSERVPEKSDKVRPDTVVAAADSTSSQ